jgi:hypothetical protein
MLQKSENVVKGSIFAELSDPGVLEDLKMGLCLFTHKYEVVSDNRQRWALMKLLDYRRDDLKLLPDPDNPAADA